jgi:hypothetical protein
VEVKSCGFLAARFKKPNDLYGETYWGTFTGRLIGNRNQITSFNPRTLSERHSRVMLMIESEEDVHGEQSYIAGEIPHVYDPQSRSFVTPE